MRLLHAPLAASLLLTVPAFVVPVMAQPAAVTNPAQNGPQNPAVKGMHENNSATPVNGANSFTKDQAKSQIEAKGYTKVSSLKKSSDGVWHAKAMKDGKSGPVSVDYQGNVN